MSEFNKNQLTPEMIKKAQECKTPAELVELAKSVGIELTVSEAEAYMTELKDFDLDEEYLENIAGGIKTCYMVDGCAFKCGTLKDC